MESLYPNLGLHNLCIYDNIQYCYLENNPKKARALIG